MSALDGFYPAVARWFQATLGAPTPPQEAAWPLLLAGQDVVVAAPTGSGKTLAAFLAALDGLAKSAAAGELKDEVHVVYVSPLKALSNDIGKNLLLPLEGVARELGQAAASIRVAVRTGDTPAKERVAMGKKAPHVLVTTPESLYVLLGSESGQKLLRTARTLILDEVHAVCGVRRGAHLALSVERLDEAVIAHRGKPLQRVGLSATQRPIELVARFVAGAHRQPATIVDVGHRRTLDLGVVLPDSPLESIMSGEVFAEVVRSLALQVEAHKTTLIFVNTRRMAERLAARLDDALADTDVGRGAVCAHHGSMSRDKRLDAEDRLKQGQLRALVATSSMELGIDVGAIDLVCQLGSTKTIAAFLQRVGRAGHQTTLIPKGRLYPLTRDELGEAGALMNAVATGDLDQLIIPTGGTDVLAQQLVATVAAAGDDGRSRTALRALVRRAWPFRDFDDKRIDEAITLSSEGVMTGRGRRGSWLYADAVSDQVRPKKGARLVSLTSGGVIPDMGDYVVVDQASDAVVGTVNEDFAVESSRGDVFQLGTASWRVEKIERGFLRVSDAQGQPASIPFWLGEAPARSRELSHHVGVLRDAVAAMCAAGVDVCATKAAIETDVAAMLEERFLLPVAGARQLGAYMVANHTALGTLPSQKVIIVERFEDSLGGTQLVIHAPFGARITRAWGLSLRKRFCRSFDFELQAAATEDGIILSVGTVSGVDLDNLVRFVTSRNIEEVLIQAILQAPIFGTRFRHNATRSLTVLRQRAGKRVPPGLLRIAAEDVLVALFPQQVACAENIVGDREVPDDPLVRQTIHDLLHEWMDIDGAVAMLKAIEAGEIEVRTVERGEPSPLAMELVGARPYAFLDDVPFEERRVQAVMARRTADSALEDETQALDRAVVDVILDEVRLQATRLDEGWDALWQAGFLYRDELTEVGGAEMPAFVDELVQVGRAVLAKDPIAKDPVAKGAVSKDAVAGRRDVFVATEHRALLQEPTHELLMELLRARLDFLPPRSRAWHLAHTPAPADLVAPVLERLVREGVALEGRFDASQTDTNVLWARRLVVRARRRMLDRLRAAIAPVSPEALMRFLFRLHHLRHSSDDPRFEGRAGVQAALRLLDGVTAPAAAWEQDILPARVRGALHSDLDSLCLSGELAWRCRPARVERPDTASSSGKAPNAKTKAHSVVRQTALTLCDRDTAAWLLSVPTVVDGLPTAALSLSADAVVAALRSRGPLFFRDLSRATGQLSTQLEQSVAEAIGAGIVTADGFGAVRGLVRSAKEKERHRRSRTSSRVEQHNPFDVAGRFALVGAPDGALDDTEALPDAIAVVTGGPAPRIDTSSSFKAAQKAEERADKHARLLLNRFGVVFRRLVERDPLLPPWRDMLGALRRLEVRGDVRGGRFVSGFSGEQFALPEVVTVLRSARDRDQAGVVTAIAAADPLNLTGIILPGARVPAVVGHRIAFVDGRLMGHLDSDGVHLHDDVGIHADAVSTALRGAAPRLFLAR